ncbi:MAG: phosphatidate cytidylyltransferase [Alphaproteobacteria bacterium]|nr:phosphatidate cytidylyltransferase [Alphaproteobacteria bacterium]
MAKSNLLKRTITALILGPLVIGSIFLEFPYFNFLVLTIGALLAWEWSDMIAQNKKAVYSTIYTLSMATAVMLHYWFGIFLMMALATVVVFVKAKGEKHRWLLALGVPYISIGVGSLMWFMIALSPLAVLWLLLVVWSVDIGGYAVGCNVKGPKLAPKISPNKTWSGLIGGMLFAGITGGVFAYLVNWPEYIYYAAVAAVLAVVEQIGDLIESAIKRKVGVKDSSSLIPGHGGVFDRVDGLIFTAPILLLGVILYSMYMF